MNNIMLMIVMSYNIKYTVFFDKTDTTSESETSKMRLTTSLTGSLLLFFLIFNIFYKDYKTRH